MSFIKLFCFLFFSFVHIGLTHLLLSLSSDIKVFKPVTDEIFWFSPLFSNWLMLMCKKAIVYEIY